MAAARKAIRWTDDECEKVAAAFKKLAKQPQFKAVHERFRNAQILRQAQGMVLPKNRWRMSKDTWAVMETLDPWLNPEKHYSPPPPVERPKRGRPPKAKTLLDVPKEAWGDLDSRPRDPLPVVAGTTLPEVIQQSMTAMGEAIAKHISWQIGLHVEKVVQGMVLPIIEQKLAAMMPVSPQDLTTALDKALEEHQAQGAVVVQTTESLPAEVETVHMAPRDRKPRVAIIGLIRQQMDDVGREFGDVIDFTFIPTHQSAAGDFQARLAHCDVAIVMTRFSSHWHDEQVKKSSVPVMRITGGISQLKAWLQKWFNGEVGLAGLPPQDHRKEGG